MMPKYYSDHYKLEYVIDLARFEQLLDALASVSGTALVAVDLRGNRITKHSACSEFCAYIRSHPTLSSYCCRCDARAGIESARIHAPYIYACHMNLVDIAIPIVVDGVYIGALMAGQIQLLDPDELKEIEQVVPRYEGLSQKDILFMEAKRKNLPAYRLGKIRDIAHLIQQIVNYIASEATAKLRFASLVIDEKDNPYIHDMYDLTQIQSTLENKNALIESPDFSELIDSMQLDHVDPILYPALRYINKYYAKKISLNDVAGQCKLSLGYFSRLFKKEMGINFNIFLSVFRLQIGKKLLQESLMKVHEVAVACGFENSSYFSRQFKQYYKKSPSEFR